eukprot:13672_3
MKCYLSRMSWVTLWTMLEVPTMRICSSHWRVLHGGRNRGPQGCRVLIEGDADVVRCRGTRCPDDSKAVHRRLVHLPDIGLRCL